MPLIFFGSNGIGLTSKLFGLTAGAAGAGVCAAACPAPIAAITAAPAVSADPACTKLRRSSSVVIVSLHTDGASVERGDRDRVEMGHAVGLGPQGYLAGIGEGAVLGGVERLAVERHREPVALGAQPERVPLARHNLHICAFDLLSSPVHDTIKADIVFERISAHDIVIIRAGEPHRDAAGLVNGTADRLEPNGDLDIFFRDRLINREREAVIGTVLTGLRDRLLGGGSRVSHDFPGADRATAGERKFKTRRRSSRLHTGDVDPDGPWLGVCGSRHESTSYDQRNEGDTAIHGVASA